MPYSSFSPCISGLSRTAPANGTPGDVREGSTASFLRHCIEEYCAFAQPVLTANAPGHIGALEEDADKLSR